MTRLKLIPLDKYILAVDQRQPVNDEYWTYIPPKEWNKPMDPPIKNGLPKEWYEKLWDRENYCTVIAHLPITEKISGLLELPEMDNEANRINNLPHYLVEKELGENFNIDSYLKGYKARGGYSESDLENMLKFICSEVDKISDYRFINTKITFSGREFLTSLKPKYFECEGYDSFGQLKTRGNIIQGKYV